MYLLYIRSLQRNKKYNFEAEKTVVKVIKMKHYQSVRSKVKAE